MKKLFLRKRKNLLEKLNYYKNLLASSNVRIETKNIDPIYSNGSTGIRIKNNKKRESLNNITNKFSISPEVS